MFIIKSNYEDIGLVGYWSGAAWSHKKSAAMKYGTYEVAEGEYTRHFSWLSEKTRSHISIVKLEKV